MQKIFHFNRQIWSNFNTFEIILGQTGAKKIFFFGGGGTGRRGIIPNTKSPIPNIPHCVHHSN